MNVDDTKVGGVIYRYYPEGHHGPRIMKRTFSSAGYGGWSNHQKFTDRAALDVAWRKLTGQKEVAA